MSTTVVYLYILFLWALSTGSLVLSTVVRRLIQVVSACVRRFSARSCMSTRKTLRAAATPLLLLLLRVCDTHVTIDVDI